MTMLNSIPGFAISGEQEHPKESELFEKYHKLPLFSNSSMKVERAGTQAQIKYGASASSSPSRKFHGFFDFSGFPGPYDEDGYHGSTDKDNVICRLQREELFSFGFHGIPLKYRVVGRKAIRLHTKDELNFLSRLFPCARFVINTRRDIDRQLHSGFWQRLRRKSKMKQELFASQRKNLTSWNSVFEDFSESQGPERVFRMFMEDYSVSLFNSLLEWLGVHGCTFQKVAHANANKSYNPASTAKLLHGYCTIVMHNSTW
mmetsp:Transcript_11864/g.33447  ORF Transcript_11864/g.33447 Transcript_11864/m.33447 type:complete len:259 (-) Transcript_11864:136-912(-)